VSRLYGPDFLIESRQSRQRNCGKFHRRKKPFAGDFVGTLRECDCVFSTLEERESPAVT